MRKIPYEAMAEKMVYWHLQWQCEQRIEEADGLPESRNRMVLFYLPTGAVRERSVHPA